MRRAAATADPLLTAGATRPTGRRWRWPWVLAASVTAGLALGPAQAVVVGITGALMMRAGAGPRPDRGPGDDELTPTVEAVELLGLCLSSGLPLAGGCRLIGRLGPVAARPAFSSAASGLDAGHPPAAAFPSELADVALVVDVAHRWGAPVAGALVHLARDLRERAAAAAETAAEQLSVRLVFPTTLLLVPAFGLLVVVPLLASALGGLDLGL